MDENAQDEPPIDEALGNDEFRISGIGIDATLDKTVDLPIERPAGPTFATALVGGRAQDVGHPDQEIIVPIPACEPIWTHAERRATDTYKKCGQRRQGSKGPRRLSRGRGEGQQGLSAYSREKLPKDPSFQALVKEAQGVADRFVAK